MTEVTRLLENPVEATTIVHNFVLLLVKTCVMKKNIRNNKTFFLYSNGIVNPTRIMFVHKVHVSP
jgi:hypothetical protein